MVRCGNHYLYMHYFLLEIMLQQININFRMINLGKQVDQGMFKGFSSTKYLKKEGKQKKHNYFGS